MINLTEIVNQTPSAFLSLKNAFRLSTQQHLAFTPQIQQTIRMLQLGVEQLSEEIDETLKDNPLLQEIRPVKTAYEDRSFMEWIENMAPAYSQSFEDHLIRQLGFLHLDSDTYVAACIIISCLDDNGYLKLSDSALSRVFQDQNISISADSIETAKNHVRQLDPAGVASSDLTDCLKQQLLRYHNHSKVYKHAVSICDHLELLAENPEHLMTLLKLDQATCNKAIALIKQLNPAPGRSFDNESVVYLQPDILLVIDQDGLSLSFNPLINRRIEINTDYVELLKNSNKQADNNYLKKNLSSARWWMNALVQRNITLMRVAEHMVSRQVDYFTRPEQSLKPLTQQDIADSLDMHISTVSRAIKDKNIQTPVGIMPLKSLLAGRIPADNNNIHSNQSVKVIMRELIKNEPSQTPLSDSKIVEKLEKRGIRIARRTVSKYREQLNIPASNLRRIK